jgi:hypothetical protein
MKSLPLKIAVVVAAGLGLGWVGLNGMIGRSFHSATTNGATDSSRNTLAIAATPPAATGAPVSSVLPTDFTRSPAANAWIAQGSGRLLSQPINCQLGKNCFVLLYPDHDASTGETDSLCRHLTYDGHNGTDFAIPFWTPTTNVAVLAAAPGRVSALRDGVADRRLSSAEERSTVSGIECGNGVTIEHADGWQTQYCHMKQGSISVKMGDTVRAGTPLGMVGLSGMTTFPHVHVTVRKNGREIDPFIGGDAIGTCRANRRPVWNQAKVDYVATGLIRSGFAPKQPVEEELWRGEFRSNQISAKAEVLTFWVHAFGVQKNDVEHFKLLAPDGSVVTDYQRPIDADRKQWITYVGKGTRQSPLMPGTWTASYQLKRGNQVLIQLDRQQAVVR